MNNKDDSRLLYESYKKNPPIGVGTALGKVRSATVLGAVKDGRLRLPALRNIANAGAKLYELPTPSGLESLRTVFAVNGSAFQVF